MIKVGKIVLISLISHCAFAQTLQLEGGYSAFADNNLPGLSTRLHHIQITFKAPLNHGFSTAPSVRYLAYTAKQGTGEDLAIINDRYVSLNLLQFEHDIPLGPSWVWVTSLGVGFNVQAGREYLGAADVDNSGPIPASRNALRDGFSSHKLTFAYNLGMAAIYQYDEKLGFTTGVELIQFRGRRSKAPLGLNTALGGFVGINYSFQWE